MGEFSFFTLFYYLLSIRSWLHKIYKQPISYKFKSKKGEPDYSNLNFWAAHPAKCNPSNCVPQDLKNETRYVLADTFFIYPTTYTDSKLRMGWNAEIDNEQINKKTDNTSILYQASVFNKYCRVFAPRYRQAHLKACYETGKEECAAALKKAYTDIRNAFEYYLENCNHGRPIIIASHSQGTWHAGELLKEFFEGQPLQRQLVCAYLVGAPVFSNYFSRLKPCTAPDDTGGFVSWRTFKEGFTPEFLETESQKAFVVNPLTWTMDEAPAPDKLNKGGMLHNFDKIIPGLVQAQIHGNILWVSQPKRLTKIFHLMNDFHIADYNLFYGNIRENVGQRIKSFISGRRAVYNKQLSAAIRWEAE